MTTDQPTPDPAGDRYEVVTTGFPPVSLIVCNRCGVLLWDADAHYRHAHSEEQDEADDA